MYHPTVFENLKVAFENHIYDLDSVEQEINITNRVDRMDFAIMARNFAVEFTLTNRPDVTAEIALEASLEELAAEILEKPGTTPGCTLLLRFYKRVQNVTQQCKQIEQAINEIWDRELQITQTLSFVYEQEALIYLDTIEVGFNHKINEDHMEDIADFLDHVLETLEVLIEI
jgi:hypothetical protein